MEENLIGYILGTLDPETHREVEGYVASHPEAQQQVAMLHRVLAPLSVDRDAIDPPEDLVLRTIARTAEHIVATEGTVATTDATPVGDFLRALHRRTEAAATPAPVYPIHASEAAPPSWSPRNLFVTGGLTVAMLLIAVAGVMSIRQTRNMQACQNNLRVMHQAISGYCDRNDDRLPQPTPGSDVREALRKLNDDPRGFNLTFVCPATGNPNMVRKIDGQTYLPSPSSIEYAYCLGYHDESGQLTGLVRGRDGGEFPILADAPDRRGDQAVPVNHRKGQNVLFLGGHVRFCTTPMVGPVTDGTPDDIYYNTAQQPRAGTHRWDAVLGRANEQP